MNIKEVIGCDSENLQNFATGTALTNLFSSLREVYSFGSVQVNATETSGSLAFTLMHDFQVRNYAQLTRDNNIPQAKYGTETTADSITSWRKLHQALGRTRF